MAVETQAARLAVTKGTSEDFDSLRRALVQNHVHADDTDPEVALTAGFHDGITRDSRNQMRVVEEEFDNRVP